MFEFNSIGRVMYVCVFFFELGWETKKKSVHNFTLYYFHFYFLDEREKTLWNIFEFLANRRRKKAGYWQTEQIVELPIISPSDSLL